VTVPHDLPADLVPAWWELNEAWSRAVTNWREAGLPDRDNTAIGELALRSSRLMATTPATTDERSAWAREQNDLVAAWEVIELANAGAAAAAIKEKTAARAAIEEAKPKPPKGMLETALEYAPWVIGFVLVSKLL
jgi:hypothetical protein